MAEAPCEAVDSVVSLAATLRAAGVAATRDRVHAAVSALAELEPARRADVYWAGRVTLGGSADDLPRFDAYFGRRPGTVVRRQRVSRTALRLVAEPGDEGQPGGELPRESVSAAASSVEQLRHRDVRTLTAIEREHLRRLLVALRLPGERRVTRRLRPSARGRVDGARTLRAWLAAGGEPARLRRRAPLQRARRVVLLGDVSGSMDSYADALLRFPHAASRRGSAPTEVFALGTRLTRLSREAHHVVWANPRKAAPGYAPLAGGMAAALPHVDDCFEGHSLGALEHLAAVVRGA